MYSKGDIVKVRFPFSDFSQGKIRPALVISDEEIHKSTGDYIFLSLKFQFIISNDLLSFLFHNPN
jgi:mRNA-degrading endonuclease toxin of MazEF toxin-antitoxin module